MSCSDERAAARGWSIQPVSQPARPLVARSQPAGVASLPGGLDCPGGKRYRTSVDVSSQPRTVHNVTHKTSRSKPAAARREAASELQRTVEHPPAGQAACPTQSWMIYTKVEAPPKCFIDQLYQVEPPPLFPLFRLIATPQLP